MNALSDAAYYALKALREEEDFKRRRDADAFARTVNGTVHWYPLARVYTVVWQRAPYGAEHQGAHISA